MIQDPAALPPAFYARPTDRVARDLVGRELARIERGRRLAGRIVETEAYFGPGDPGSHARRGPTPRSRIMWGPPGVAYVYFVYGNHDMLNVVAHAPGDAGAVLIRAVEPVEGVARMARRRACRPDSLGLTNGPGKLCAAFGVGVRAHNGHRLDRPPLWIARGTPVRRGRVERGQRIGLGADDGRPMRFWERGNPWVGRAGAGTAAVSPRLGRGDGRR